MGSGSFMGSGGSVSDDSKAMPQTLDTASADYDTHVWNNPDVMTYQAPTGTWEQNAIRQANIVVTLPRAQLRKMVKPPLPQLSPKGVRRQPSPSIEDVLGVTDTYSDRRAFFSGSAAGYQGSTRNADGIYQVARDTIYNGSVPCPGCGRPLTPVEVMWTDLCPDCTGRRVRALVEERLTAPMETE